MGGAREFCEDYTNNMHALWEDFNTTELAKAAELIKKVVNNFGTIFVCGNGGSAAIANHLHCDFQKGGKEGSHRVTRVISLSANLELITAISNDIGNNQIFSYQLANMARPGDLLIVISVSGNSENILLAVSAAQELNMSVIAMTGFDGGAVGADININIPTTNYGMAEDFFSSCMHMISQYLHQVNK